MKQHLSTIVLVAILLVGLGFLAYPTVSDWWNSNMATHMVSDYQAEVEKLSDEEIAELWDAAVAWNEHLASTATTGLRSLTDAERSEYERLLIAGNSDAICSVEIPQIHVNLPVYHGTSDAVLQSGAGHLEGSSLPVGGESTHCVISGHRGLPSAKLFSRLDELREGDHFMLHTLGTTLTYEVDQILIVEPDQVDSLGIAEGQDLCTLVTCTPYGVNTHRLLVRGHRVPNDSALEVPADALQIDRIVVACVVAVPVLAVMLAWLALSSRARRHEREAVGTARAIAHADGGEGAPATTAAAPAAPATPATTAAAPAAPATPATTAVGPAQNSPRRRS